jgi:hypothetical protein
MENKEMRDAFLALQVATQARLKAGAEPPFAKIVAHISASLRVLDGIDGTECDS